MTSIEIVEKNDYETQIQKEVFDCKKMIVYAVFDPQFSTNIIDYYYNAVNDCEPVNLVSYNFNDSYKFIDIVYNGIGFFDLKNYLDTKFDEFCYSIVSNNNTFYKLLEINMDLALLFKKIVYDKSYLMKYFRFNIMSFGTVQDNNQLLRITLV